jgi:hypothetical protein
MFCEKSYHNLQKIAFSESNLKFHNLNSLKMTSIARDKLPERSECIKYSRTNNDPSSKYIVLRHYFHHILAVKD